MKLVGYFVVCFLVSILIAEPIITGNSIIESEKVNLNPINITDGKFLLEREMLQNPGFETGSLYPWTTNNWVIDSTYPNKGRYCASDVGNFWIRQNIIPIHSSRINRISFWARQPEAPAAQAYDFIYSDSTIEEFVHYPTAEWAEYDVTHNLNQQKILVAFQLWGYSGGGPNPDSTYIDDVSILRYLDIVITGIVAPRDTFYMGDTISPSISVRNYGEFIESLWVWCRIEHICSSHIYRDSILIRDLPPLGQRTVTFTPWTPRYFGQHRFRFELSPYDTTPWAYFWVVEGSAIKENNDFLLNNIIIVRPTIGKSFEFVYEPKIPKVLKIYNSAGELVWIKKISAKMSSMIKWFGTDHLNRSLSPGVYIARLGNITKRIILTK
jgi:hypothetical protein